MSNPDSCTRLGETTTGVQEVDGAGLELLAVEGVADHHQSARSEAVGGFKEPEAGLLIERGVVCEPQHDSTGIPIELEVVVAAEQGLDDGRCDDCLAGTGRCGEGESHGQLPPSPVLPGPLKEVQHVGDGFFLVVLERVPHCYSRPVFIVKLVRYDS